jgi:hypothetical protein
MVAATTPGWYPDPWEQAELRWWDGQRWTGAVTSDASSPPPQPTAAGTGAGTGAGPPGGFAVDRAAIRRSTGRALVLIGAFLTGCGSIGPWAELSAPLVDETVMVVGTDGDGVLTLVGAIAMAGLALFGFGSGRSSGAPIGTLAVAAAVGIIAVIDIVNVDTRVAEFAGHGASGALNATLQAGLWLVMIGAGTAVVGCILYLAARRPSPT